MLYIPNQGFRGSIEENCAVNASEYGTALTANASIHTKATTYTTLIAATAFPAYGITIMLSGLGSASTNSRCLCDIAIGASTSEVNIIDNLICGNSPPTNGAGGAGVAMYHFPIYIASGVRISARIQALITADVANCAIWLHESPSGPGGWYGTRVTSYGPNTSTSSGVSHTPGSSGAYGTATEIIASTTNPIKYFQIGEDTGTATTAVSTRGLVRIGLGATPNYIVSDLPIMESTTVENVSFSSANFILSHMKFAIPAATSVRLSAMNSGTAAARGWAIYGVD